ncbi:MAG: hypothetical protein ACOYOP_11320 [Microthrixaceae bacterium]
MALTAPAHDGPTGPTDAPAATRRDPVSTSGDRRADHSATLGAERRHPPLVVHALLALLCLVGLAALAGPDRVGITDEGVVVAQVDHLDRGSWWIPNAAPELDPAGRLTPIELSDVADDGAYLPYAKHAAYPLLLLPAWRLGGVTGLLAVSVLGVWVAAVAGALLARRVDRRAATPTLWLLAVGSPLVFDANVVMAHGPAAAAVGLTAVAALAVALDRRWWALVPLVPASVAAVLLRSEGLLAVAALGGGVLLGAVAGRVARPGRSTSGDDGVVAAPERAPIGPSLVVGLGLPALGAVTYLADGRLAARVAGRSGLRTFTTAGGGFDLLGGRVDAAWASLLRPDSLPAPVTALLTVVAAVSLVAGAVVLRMGGAEPVAGRRRTALVLWWLAATAAAVRLAMPPVLITGLFAVFPLLLVGAVLLRRSRLVTPTVRVLATASVLGGLAVLATSYDIGGSAEWGGRYFHVLLPLAAPVVVVALVDALGRLDRPTASGLVAALVVLLVATTATEVRVERRLQDRAAVLTAAVNDVARRAPAGDGRAPVVAFTTPGVARLDPAGLDRTRYLFVDPATGRAVPVDLARRLRAAGVDRVTWVVPAGAGVPAGFLEEGWRVTARRGVGSLTPRDLLTVEAR